MLACGLFSDHCSLQGRTCTVWGWREQPSSWRMETCLTPLLWWLASLWGRWLSLECWTGPAGHWLWWAGLDPAKRARNSTSPVMSGKAEVSSCVRKSVRSFLTAEVLFLADGETVTPAAKYLLIFMQIDETCCCQIMSQENLVAPNVSTSDQSVQRNHYFSNKFWYSICNPWNFASVLSCSFKIKHWWKWSVPLSHAGKWKWRVKRDPAAPRRSAPNTHRPTSLPERI